MNPFAGATLTMSLPAQVKWKMTRLPVLRRIPHGLVAKVVDQRENDRMCCGNSPLGAARREAQEDTRCKQEEENGNEQAHPNVHGYTLSLDFLTAALRPKGPVLFYHRTRWNG